jgi:photosystem II stability/assembly factor-like uncharacterized protein
MMNTGQCLHFITPQKGLIIDNHGVLYITDDSGRSWKKRDEPPIQTFNGVFRFIDEKIGFLFGATFESLEKYPAQTNTSIGVYYDPNPYFSVASILKTVDGGESWQPIYIPFAGRLNCAAFADVSVGWAVGERATILHTNNGGNTWQKQKCPVRGNIWWIECDDEYSAHAFISEVPFSDDVIRNKAEEIWKSNGKRKGYENEDWIEAERQLGTSSLILQTNDSGNTWKTIVPPNDLSPYQPGSIFFADQLRGARPNGYYLEFTIDGGRMWSKAIDNSSHNMFSDLCFIDSIGFAIAGNYSGTFTLIRSDDGGASWNHIFQL